MSGGRGEKREVRGVMREGNGSGGGVMRDEWGTGWERGKYREVEEG